MFRHYYFIVVIIPFAILFIDKKCQGQSIPKQLQACYLDVNNNVHESMALPMRMDIFIELVRKYEHHEDNIYKDAGSMASLLLSQYWRDGIEVDRNIIVVDPDVIPYKTTGFESHKYELIAKYMLSSKVFSDYWMLPKMETCTLHRMLSRSVDIWERGNEFSVCDNYLDSKETDGSDGFRKSSCPIERGVVSAGSLGTISLSNVLLAIATWQRPMNVPLAYILNNPDIINDTVDNTWITLTGDLSEVLIRQIPLNASTYTFGPRGKWNDTDVPVEYYMTMTGEALRNQLWQFTDAEILGAIDGLMMAEEAVKWLNNDNPLRLSQLLEAYYTKDQREYSIQPIACQRRHFFNNYLLKNKNLPQEVKNFVDALQHNMPTYIKEDSITISITQELISKFREYTENLLWNQMKCPEGLHMRPKIKINTIVNAPWANYNTQKFLMAFGKNIDLSPSGSKLTLIRGDNGKIITKSEYYLGNIFVEWRRIGQLGVPTLPKSLMSVRELVFKREAYDQKEPYAHVTLILGTSAILSDSDVSNSVLLLKSIRRENPDMIFIYVTSTPLAPMYVKLTSIPGSVNDEIITEHNDLHERILDDLLLINRFPRAIKPRRCSNLTRNQNLVKIQSYANPAEILSYRIHPCYLTRSTQINIEISNNDKGNIIACISREEEAIADECKEAAITEITHFSIKRPCPSQEAFGQNPVEWNEDCRPIYIQITGKRSYGTCRETSCRMPDDIPFEMTVDGLQCIQDYAMCSHGELLKYNSIIVIFSNIFLSIYKMLN